MSLQIFNTLGKKKEIFTPLEAGKVKMYVCGPTVYDLLHVGNFRGAIFFNLVRNWLEHSGYKVTFVYNYTDIDDKIINRAHEQKISAVELSQKFIAEFEKDFSRLSLKRHEYNPKCTDHISEMVSFIGQLIDKNYAYAIEGEVFYSIKKFNGYGKLSGKNIDDLQAGHRVDPDPRKKDPLDFVLWKPSKEGEPSWASPWGKGRPGWHIECSCMTHRFLGEQIDIHGGGIDLIFPHHENEIAQTEGAFGKSFSRYWMHNNFIRFGEQKMSKSLGNVVTAREFMDEYDPEILKFMILSVHYRSMLNLEDEQIEQAMARLARIYEALRKAEEVAVGEISGFDQEFEKLLAKADENIAAALNDDFNTPVLFAEIFEIVRAFNATFVATKILPQHQARSILFKKWISTYGVMTSLFSEKPAEFLRKLDLILLRGKKISVKDIEDLIGKRREARDKKDFKAADAIRDELINLGIILKDSPTATNWEVKKT